MGKKSIFAVLLAFCAAFSCSAKSLSFQILQKNDSLTEVCESSLAFEDEILNYFFEKGYIVSNAPAVVSNSEEDDIKYYSDSFREASEGTVDYFCFIKVYFTGGEKENQKISLGNLKNISWKIVSVESGNVLEESSSKVKEKISQDDMENVRKFASDFALHIHNVLIKKGVR